MAAGDLAAAGVCKRFDAVSGDRGEPALEILRDIDLELASGTTAAITGASGAGKSTFLHVLGGLEQPSEGTVRIAGQDVYALRDARRAELRNRAIGFVFQFHHLLREFTAVENVEMPARIAGLPEAGARIRARTLLEEVGLADRLDHRPGELSGGEQQRVALARALVREPAIVLADEPTGNLDAGTGASVFDLLLELNRARGITLLVVTHNRELASRLDRRYEMADGFLEEVA